jgi:hypothetical protein
MPASITAKPRESLLNLRTQPLPSKPIAEHTALLKKFCRKFVCGERANALVSSRLAVYKGCLPVVALFGEAWQVMRAASPQLKSPLDRLYRNGS